LRQIPLSASARQQSRAAQRLSHPANTGGGTLETTRRWPTTRPRPSSTRSTMRVSARTRSPWGPRRPRKCS
jgi:hypothetical protein